ncbi:MAG: imelysin family protein, partial [Pseudomonadota bacterium]
MKTFALRSTRLVSCRATCLALGIAGLLFGCETPSTTSGTGTSTASPSSSPGPVAATAVAPTMEAIVSNYIAIAQAAYGDSLLTARTLESAVTAFLNSPSANTLNAAREAWKQARIPYIQTEAFRFGNSVVDEWEGRVNSWPLDEGLIDYVADSYGDESDNNFFYTANIIANPVVDIGGISVDAGSITPELLAETLHSIDGVDANVATGYHAIEFLLWGQDLHGTAPGAGERAYTDYDTATCTNGNCDRRRAYLDSATKLLVADLEEMVQSWQPGGTAYVALQEKGTDG